MTTAFANTLHGRPLAAIKAQPAGFALAIATILAALASLRAFVLGRWPLIPFWNWSPYRVFLTVLIVLTGSWIWKVFQVRAGW